MSMRRDVLSFLAGCLIGAVLCLLWPELAGAQAPPSLTATRAADGAVTVTWSSPTRVCLKLTGLNPASFVEGQCGTSGTVVLDAGQAQYKGVGRMIGLWDGASWAAGPIALPGYTLTLPTVVQLPGCGGWVC